MGLYLKAAIEKVGLIRNMGVAIAMPYVFMVDEGRK